LQTHFIVHESDQSFKDEDSMTYSSAIDLVRSIKSRLAISGLDADSLFNQAGLQESECLDDDAITLADKLSHLWDLATQLTGDPLLGLHIALPQPLEHSGLMGHIMRASADVRTAIENLVRYTPLVSPSVNSTIEYLPSRIRVTLQLPGGQRKVPQQHYDFVWCMVLRTLQCAAGRDTVRPVLVSFSFPAPVLPHQQAAYAEAFGCEVRFDAPSNSMEFDEKDLTTTIPSANPHAADWALRMLSDLAQSQRNWTLRMLARIEQTQHSATTFSARVQRLLEEMLPDGEPLREEVARRLMTSERTLQRRLFEEGTNFTRLVDDTRRVLAQRHLGSGQLSLKRLSFQLGFSDPSAFCRACKRWFGLSPKQLQHVGVGRALRPGQGRVVERA
jgi:AraC-like DNA-binding protein